MKKSNAKLGMVDISQKKSTLRVAIATGRIVMKKETLQALLDQSSPKGDVLATAKIAGIMAAKSTPTIIPLCHPLALSKVNVTFLPQPEQSAILIKAEVNCFGQTGVEMEALTAVTAAALTIYDMMKWKEKGMVISDIQLLHKSGGKSGLYNRLLK